MKHVVSQGQHSVASLKTLASIGVLFFMRSRAARKCLRLHLRCVNHIRDCCFRRGKPHRAGLTSWWILGHK